MTCGRKIGIYDCCSVIQGDCLQLMAALPDGCVDAVITDPPYGIGLKTNYTTLPKQGGKSHPAVFGDDKEFDPAPFLLFPKVILWGAQNFARSLPKSNGWLVWDKRDGAEPDAWFGDCELAWTNLAGGVRYFGRRWTGIALRNGEGHHHPTQKPVNLMEWCIDRLDWVSGPYKKTAPTQIILDPFCGSGTTLVAAKKLGRHYLGFEVSADYCRISRERLDRVEAQPSLFQQKPEQLGLIPEAASQPLSSGARPHGNGGKQPIDSTECEPVASQQNTEQGECDAR